MWKEFCDWFWTETKKSRPTKPDYLEVNRQEFIHLAVQSGMSLEEAEEAADHHQADLMGNPVKVGRAKLKIVYRG